MVSLASRPDAPVPVPAAVTVPAVQAGEIEETLLMRTLVVGAGTTGGFFGARLAQAGHDCLLARLVQCPAR